MIDINSMSNGMPWPQTHLGLPYKDHAIKGLVVCYVVWSVSMKWMALLTSEACRFGPLLWSGWQSISCTATTHRSITTITLYVEELWFDGCKKYIFLKMCKSFRMNLTFFYPQCISKILEDLLQNLYDVLLVMIYITRGFSFLRIIKCHL